MTKKKTTLTDKVIPTKGEAKDTTLETIAIGAIPIGIGLIQVNQIEAGALTAAIGIICLVLKYKLRA